jgi:glutathione S-transferase
MVLEKLYYSPAALYGAAAFIASFVAGLNMSCETVEVFAFEKKAQSGTEFKSINKLDTIPCLVMISGHVISEEATLLEYIGDKVNNTLTYYV